MQDPPQCPVCGFPNTPGTCDLDDVRRGLAHVRRALDEEGWAVGWRGRAIFHLAEQLGQALREFAQDPGEREDT